MTTPPKDTTERDELARKKRSPEHQADMLLCRMILNEVVIPPEPAADAYMAEKERRNG